MADVARPTLRQLLAGIHDVPAFLTAPAARKSASGRRCPLTALFGMLLLEFGDFAMLRRMLRGIKVRAEALAREGSRLT